MNKEQNTVLVIDAGGRGAALVHKYSQSPFVSRVLAVPGNDLMQINSQVPVVTFPELLTTSKDEILEIAVQEKADLIDVAQDNAVEAGVTDLLLENGFKVIGPTRHAGQIEWDKAWARDFMKKYGLPTPEYHAFSDEENARKFIMDNPGKKWFVKASGLADGKGAIPAENEEQALAAISEMSKFEEAGETFVIEEWLVGEEFSFFAISDGVSAKFVGAAQDHKRLYDNDMGPNTGGMGCSTPPLVVTDDIREQAENIIQKTIAGMREEGRPYKGVLYLGGIVVDGKVFIIEFNARWGDPEAEVLIPGIQNDLFEIGMEVANGKLNQNIKLDGKARVAVTGALKPGAEVKPRRLTGVDALTDIEDVIIYGTRVQKKDGEYIVSSGRLFHVVGVGRDVIDARKKAYAGMSKLQIEGDNLHYRTDIGWRDVERLKT